MGRGSPLALECATFSNQKPITDETRPSLKGCLRQEQVRAKEVFPVLVVAGTKVSHILALSWVNLGIPQARALTLPIPETQIQEPQLNYNIWTNPRENNDTIPNLFSELRISLLSQLMSTHLKSRDLDRKKLKARVTINILSYQGSQYLQQERPMLAQRPDGSFLLSRHEWVMSSSKPSFAPHPYFTFVPIYPKNSISCLAEIPQKPQFLSI